MHNFPICHLDVIVANAARTNAQDPALVHARFTAPNLILALCPQLTFHHLLVCARGCAVFCVRVCVRASVGSLVYNFKVGLRQQEAKDTHKECAGKIRSNVCVTFTAYYGKQQHRPPRFVSVSVSHSLCLSLACVLRFILYPPAAFMGNIIA